MTTESHDNHEPTPLLGLGSSAGLGPLPGNAHNDELAYSSNMVAAIVAAQVAAERERCAKLCDEARAAVWPYHDAEVFKVAQTVCENLANRIRGLGA